MYQKLPFGRAAQGLGNAKQSLVPLLNSAQQAQLLATQAVVRAAAEAAQAKTAADRAAQDARVVPFASCNAAAQAAAMQKAQATGGCIDLALCDNMGRPVSAPVRRCYDDPVVKAGVINQIKADEIEAGALEKMLEMAKVPDANSDQHQQNLEENSVALEQEAHELKAEHEAEAAAAEARSAELARLRQLHAVTLTTANKVRARK